MPYAEVNPWLAVFWHKYINVACRASRRAFAVRWRFRCCKQPNHLEKRQSKNPVGVPRLKRLSLLPFRMRKRKNRHGGKLFFGILTKIHIFVGRFSEETQTKIIQYEEIIINSACIGNAIFVVCQRS
jgi:hypothetical protein